MDYKQGIKIGIHKLVNLALIGAALGLIITSIIVYNTWPIYTATNIIPQEDAKFPDLTFCSLSNGYKEQVLKKHGIASIKRYNNKENLNWISNHTQISPQQLFLDSTFSVEEIVKKINIRFIKADEKGIFHENIGIGDSQNLIIEQQHRKFGRCYTFSPDSRMRSLGIYYIKLQFLINVKIYIHAKDQFLDLSGRMGYKVHIDDKMQFQVDMEEMQQLEYKDVSNALWLTSSDKSCSHKIYDECMYGAVTRIMRENSEHNCTVPWVRNNSEICSTPKDINTTFWIGWNRITNQEKDCLPPCKTTKVNLGAKNYEKMKNSTYSLVYFYFPSRVSKSQEHYLYTFLKLIGQIGGYLGLYRLFLWILGLMKFDTLVTDSKNKNNGGEEGAAAARDALDVLDAL